MVHADALSWQQSVERPVARHVRPVQHVLVAPAVQALPLAVQATIAQCPAVQVLPVQQSAVAAQVAPVAAQAVAEQ